MEEARGNVRFILGLLALAALTCFAYAHDRSSRAIDLEYHLPNRPPAEEVIRGIELALEEHGNRAGPYRVTPVPGKTKGARALRLPGFKPVSCVAREIPGSYPVERSWGAYGIEPKPDVERSTVLAWIKAKGISRLGLLYNDALLIGPEAKLAGISIALYPEDEIPKGRDTLLILGGSKDAAVQYRTLKADGHDGPVLMPNRILWAETLQDMEGVLVCLAPRKAAPESFVREYLARYGSEPTACAYAGYSSLTYAIGALAGHPLLPQDQLTQVHLQLDSYNPWREPVGEAEVCEYREGIFHPLMDKQ